MAWGGEEEIDHKKWQESSKKFHKARRWGHPLDESKKEGRREGRDVKKQK